MAYVTRNIRLVDNLLKMNKINEQALAKELYEKFEEPALLSPLQRVVSRIIASMLNSNVLNSCPWGEGFLKVWTTRGDGSTTANSLERIFSNHAHLDPTDCSDIIRLAGAWVEKNGAVSAWGTEGEVQTAWGQKLTPAAAAKEAYRPGVKTVGGDAWKQPVEKVWGDKKDRFANVQTAVRDRTTQGIGFDRAIPEYLRDYMRKREDFSGIGGNPQRPGDTSGKTATGQSNVLKIDKLFGLFVGADISGTTTDTVFALETWGHPDITAAYYLLPVATIVHNFHHALIEVALSLSLNDLIDYHIGFYTTLWPKRAPLDGLNGTRNILNAHEQAYKPLMLFYEPGNAEPAGAVVFSMSEKAQMSGSRLTSALEWLRNAPGMNMNPTLDFVKGHCDRNQILVEDA